MLWHGLNYELPPGICATKKSSPTESQRPRIYGVPKTHKEGTPFRPTLSVAGSSHHELGEWLASPGLGKLRPAGRMRPEGAFCAARQHL